MSARDPDEPHRSATALELFFDLVFVVAIAQAASGLHHGIADGHVAEAVLNYFLVFFAIWWAWMGFTWFASAYDTDDVPYRIAVFVQLTGALILAAGVGPAFASQDYRIVVVGYVIMRVPMIYQRLRSAQDDPQRRASAHRHAAAMTILQICWVGLVFAPRSLLVGGLVFFGTLELVAVVWAERSAPTTWHRGHIAERYGLLTIIVLGESVLAATVALESIFEAGQLAIGLAPTILGGLLTMYGMWWLYFDRPVAHLLTSLRIAFVWGYGHLLVYASAAAAGAGLVIALDQATGHAEIPLSWAGASLAVPVAIYLLMLWTLHERPRRDRGRWLLPLGALLLLGTPFLAEPVLAVGLLVVLLVAAKVALANTPPTAAATKA